MEPRVSYDKLDDLLSELGEDHEGADGIRWRPMRDTVTLTSSKHAEGNSRVFVEADLDDYSWSWRSSELFVVETADTDFLVPRDQVGEILNVNLPEQPYARTVSIELVPDLTLDVTFEYVDDDPAS